MSADIKPFTQADLDALREKASAVTEALEKADAEPLIYMSDDDPFRWDGSRTTYIVDGAGVLAELHRAGWELIKKVPA